jgi:hypothetical protein
VSKQRPHSSLGAKAKLLKTSSVDFEPALSTPHPLGAADFVYSRRTMMCFSCCMIIADAFALAFCLLSLIAVFKTFALGR